MKLVAGGKNGETPEENLPRFHPSKTHMERREFGTLAVEASRLTACATVPPV